MNEDSIIKIFRTRMASTALQTYRDQKILDEIKSNERLVGELYSLFAELESKYSLLTNEQEIHVAAEELANILTAKVGGDSIALIANWISLNSDDTLISLENSLA